MHEKVKHTEVESPWLSQIGDFLILFEHGAHVAICGQSAVRNFLKKELCLNVIIKLKSPDTFISFKKTEQIKEKQQEIKHYSIVQINSFSSSNQAYTSEKYQGSQFSMLKMNLLTLALWGQYYLTHGQILQETTFTSHSNENQI